jgi:RNA polymerase sigma factor for flagellar operon FliA
MRTTAKERRHLVDENVSFVRSVAAKIKEQLPREIEFDDLVSYGMQGLLEAAERYDLSHGVAFTTFAYYRVRGAIFDGLRGMGWLPRGEYARLRVEERASAYLGNLADRDAGDRERPPDLEEDVRSIADALGGVAAIFVTALDARREREGAAADPSVHEVLEDRDRARTIRDALNTLPEKERRLIDLYYFQDRSLLDAGQALGLSKSWASRLHARAISLLKGALERAGAGPEPDVVAGPAKKRRARR